jgi:hypothetical protein
MSGILAMSGYKITGMVSSGVLDPNDAAPVWYIDQRASGIKFHTEVKVATTGPITLSGLQTIDGYTVIAGDRVLVRNQHNGVLTAGLAVANGIYVAGTGAWTRATDADASGEIAAGSAVVVLNGTSFANTAMVSQIPASQQPWVPGSSDNYWVIFSARPTVQAGAGLLLTGQTVDIVPADTTITVGPDNIKANVGTAAGTVAAGNHTHADVPNTRQVIAGTGLTGGGALSADVTINAVGDGTTISAAADSLSAIAAPKWLTPRTVSLTGDVTGSASVDGTANVAIATTIAGGSAIPKFFAGDVGASTSGASVITHNLNTTDVMIQVFRKGAPMDTVYLDMERTSANTVTLRFATDVGAGVYRCVVIGK